MTVIVVVHPERGTGDPRIGAESERHAVRRDRAEATGIAISRRKLNSSPIANKSRMIPKSANGCIAGGSLIGNPIADVVGQPDPASSILKLRGSELEQAFDLRG